MNVTPKNEMDRGAGNKKFVKYSEGLAHEWL